MLRSVSGCLPAGASGPLLLLVGRDRSHGNKGIVGIGDYGGILIPSPIRTLNSSLVSAVMKEWVVPSIEPKKEM